MKGKQHVRKISIAFGNLVQSLALIVGFYLAVVAAAQPFLAGLILSLAAWVILWFFSHCLAHYLVGRATGIRFDYYFVGRSSIRKLNLPGVTPVASLVPALGIRANPEAMRRASPRVRARMFRAGALSSMLLPFLVPMVNLVFQQLSIAVVLLVVSSANLAFTAYFSPRAGDFRKASYALRRL